MDGLAAVFSNRLAAQEAAESSEAKVKLYAKIEQLLMEQDFLAKASGHECRAEAADD